MIQWRTSRFLIFFLLILLSIVAMSAYVVGGQATLLSLGSAILPARFTATPVPSLTPTAEPGPVNGTAVELPHYPPLHVVLPARSLFAPAA